MSIPRAYFNIILLVFYRFTDFIEEAAQNIEKICAKIVKNKGKMVDNVFNKKYNIYDDKKQNFNSIFNYNRRKMTNIFDYIKWRGDVMFSSSSLNEIDSLIFCQLSYIPFDNIISADFSENGLTIEEIYDLYFDIADKKINMGAIIPTEKIIPLLEMLSHSERFKDIRLHSYVNEISEDEEKQFSAVCFDIPSESLTYVAFRGTDDNIIGWKEDCNMALFTPIPAQKNGVKYLNEIAKNTKNKLILGGHSKGGNIAVYSSFLVEKEAKSKVIAVHNFDGPGFREDFLEITKSSPTVIRKITNFLPESSLIGSIFDTVGRRIYVKSNAKGLYQHDAFTWYLERIHFITVPSLSKSSAQFHKSLKQWVADMSDVEKKEFVDAFFKLCTVNDSGTLTDIVSNKFKFIGALFKADDKSKKTVMKTVLGSVRGFLGIKKKQNKLTKHEKDILAKAHILALPPASSEGRDSD